MQKSKTVVVAFTLLTIGYAAVLAGLSFASENSLFKKLIPFLLVYSCFTLLYFHPAWRRKDVILFTSIAILSWILHVVGVQTGKIFGSYFYTDVLPIRVWSVPVLIGVVWLQLIYCAAHLVSRLQIGMMWREITGAAIITMIDYFIEPVASAFNWWKWEGGVAPVRNFVAWFYLSFLFLFYFFRMRPSLNNPAALPVFILLTAFLIALNMLLLMAE